MDPFVEACKNGDLKLAKEIYNGGGIDYHAKEEYAFQYACANDHLEVAKWLFFELGGIDHHVINDVCFTWACGWGNLKVAKWLFYELGGVNLDMCYEEAFGLMCDHDLLESAVWLWSIGGLDYNFLKSELETNYFDCPKIIKWIFFLNTEFHNNIPDKLLNDVFQINVFENNQLSLIDNCTQLIIS